MLNEFCISMPYLHPAPAFRAGSERESRMGDIKYLWPGHGRAPSASAWQPPSGFPFQPDEAALIMNDIKNQTLPELDRMRFLARSGLHKEERDFRSEMASLADFAEQRPEPRGFPGEDAARQAQLNLLWLWLQEERFLEITSLARRCEAEASCLLEAALGHDEKPLSLDSGEIKAARELLPDWKTVFLNAAFFIDPNLPVLLEGTMREDLAEYFTDDNSEFSQFREGLKKAKLPLWRILGIPRPRRSDLPSRFWDAPRLLISEPL